MLTLTIQKKVMMTVTVSFSTEGRIVSQRSLFSFDLTICIQMLVAFHSFLCFFIIFKDHMYVYEGKDYSKEPSREDKKAFDQLLDLQKALTEETTMEGRALRNKTNVRQKKRQGI